MLRSDERAATRLLHARICLFAVYRAISSRLDNRDVTFIRTNKRRYIRPPEQASTEQSRSDRRESRSISEISC